ncbi:Endoplasmic reticulum resident protein 44 [Acropora cervicornis]|uniref:Endoplasmic reticulum resident protein 44 n=1 Tax=Acropora cervicornis TaxID=6130 RepID=A0AAD9QFW6_ACRCE|nr:Endoplasmic reticulum resident protein 44 [Acropora cervicornis]
MFFVFSSFSGEQISICQFLCRLVSGRLRMCRFSQMLAPVFEQASDIVKEEYPSGVVLGRVDCEAEQEIAQRFHITKYPTLKIWRNSEVTRREYRGQRSVDAFSNYVREQMKSKVQEFHTLADLHVDASKRNVIAYLESKDSANFNNFEKVAEEFREDCHFHFGVGDASVKERQTGDNIKGQEAELIYMGDLSNFDLLKTWVSDKCIPLVREITFENAEELTEEGIPFLLLFYHPDDKSSIELYKAEVSKQLIQEKVNGSPYVVFLLCILKETPNTDDAAAAETLTDNAGTETQAETEKPDSRGTGSGSGKKEQTTPPETVFKKLAPSYNRYTLLRDEL